MRRTPLAAALVGAATLTAVLALLPPGPSPAGPQAGGAGQAPTAGPGRPAQLPIAQVVLYSSGVGYFQREGTVEGETRVDLSFPTQDINDLLKSMVLRDLDGGHGSAVSYDSNAPLERTLPAFAVTLTGNPTFTDHPNQATGQR